MAANLSNGIIGWWKFDEGSGSSALDSSGHGNTGTLENSPTWISGYIGKGALSFNGTNQHMTTNNTSWDDLSDGISLCLWFKVTSLSQYNRLITIETSAENSYGIYIQTEPSGVIQFGFPSSSYTNSPTISINTWYHVVGVSNYTNGGTLLYVNGVSVGTAFSGSPAYVANLGTLDVARLMSGGVAYYAQADIDDVRIYNRPLTSVEIQQLYRYRSNKAAFIIPKFI